MNTCPKCSCTRINGPVYEKDCFGERLVFRCARCSYKSTEPTHDAQERALDRIRSAK